MKHNIGALLTTAAPRVALAAVSWWYWIFLGGAISLANAYKDMHTVGTVPKDDRRPARRITMRVLMLLDFLEILFFLENA